VTWGDAIGGGLVGSLVTVLLTEWIRGHRVYRTAVLVIHAEVLTNVVRMNALLEDAASKEQWRGWFKQDAWETHRQEIARRWARKHIDLWAKINAVNPDLEAYSATGNTPSALAQKSLKEVHAMVREIVPPFRVRVGRRLMRRSPHFRRLAWLLVWPRRPDDKRASEGS
jgi:hypothetical protein